MPVYLGDDNEWAGDDASDDGDDGLDGTVLDELLTSSAGLEASLRAGNDGRGGGDDIIVGRLGDALLGGGGAPGRGGGALPMRDGRADAVPVPPNFAVGVVFMDVRADGVLLV